MMNAGRRNMTSVDEPNAFRIARAVSTFDAPNSSLNKEGKYVFNPEYGPTPHSTFSRAAPEFQQTHPHPFEPASWLAARDLSSPAFSAHDFLQRVLSQRYDKSARPTHIPVLGDSFDADAALAALDTVESGLRKQRDVSRHEEEVARDALRKALHLSAKKREQLVRTADAVSANISTFGDVGRQAAKALNSDVSTLKEAADHLASLQDARDLVSLLTMESSELDAVRVSKLLAKARQHIEDGSLALLLPDDDMDVAREEIGRCENELASSINEWMKNAVDSGNNQVVRDCALAADELNISQTFIDSYISHTFAFDEAGPGGKWHVSISLENVDSLDVLQQFRVACWETVNSVGEILPTICESFSNPSRALASVLRILSNKKVVPVAEAIMSTLLSRVTSSSPLDSYRADDSSSSDLMNPPALPCFVERLRSLAISDAKENWQERAGRAAAERRRFLMACTEVFKSMAKLRSDLFTQYCIPGADRIEDLFDEGTDPFIAFANRWMSEYLKSEKAWIDQQFGTAFYDITRIEAHAPRLAPRETSDVGAYHRYRAFYSHISSRYQQMTRSAIESTCESLCRAVAVLSTIFVTGHSTESDFSPSRKEHKGASIDESRLPHGMLAETGSSAKTEEKRSSWKEDGDKDAGSKTGFSVKTPRTAAEVTQLLRELLDGLVMCYLANSETILQAATHLLPISEYDAQLQELWVSGASPLTAYMQAVDVLSRSNEVLDEFLLTLEMTDYEFKVSTPSMMPDDDLSRYVPHQTRELLHRELTIGLSDLGVEAQVGVRAAVASVRARLFAMLSTPNAKRAYTSRGGDERSNGKIEGDPAHSTVGLDIEPSPAFMSASTFIEQQLQSVLSNVHGGNREFVISELSVITKEAVLNCWCSCEGPLSLSGALQLVADGRAMSRVFQNHRETAVIVECLPAVGQLFLESAEELWKCVESKSLATVEARTLVELLKKREDHHAERVVKVCQSLGATLDEL